MNNFEPFEFKFRWMEDGNVSGYLPLSGMFDGKTLTLDEQDFAVSVIAGVAANENILTLIIEDDEAGFVDVSIVPSGQSPDDIKRSIDSCRSHIIVAQEQKRLVEAGQGSSFRSEVCPHCAATVSLSRFPDTPQCYCIYCETLFTIRNRYGSESIESGALPVELEPKYRLCDKCEMYSYPRQFSIFYFIFLVYFIHFDSRKTVRCPGCMRLEAWKMLLGNIFGVLGLPLAIIQLWRSYRGRIERGPLKGLDDANSLSRRGKVEKALDRYDALMDNLPINAGIKYNIASGLLKKNDISHAETMFLLSLDDCANYTPSLEGLHICYHTLGKTAELGELEYQMGFDEA